MSWTDKLWLFWPGHDRILYMAGRRYEYLLLAAATSCLLEDKAAGLAAIATANLTSPDGRVMMLKYLKYLEIFLEDSQRLPAVPITALHTLAKLVSAIRELDSKGKRNLLREFRNSDREYHRAWRTWYADPDVFVRRHPEIKIFQEALPQWLRDAMYGWARVCPKCGLASPALAQKCDCGHALTDRDCPNWQAAKATGRRRSRSPSH